jgi:hypothetical protein
MGVLLSNDMWEDFLEDMEAMSSPTYIASIKKARKEKRLYTPEEVKKILGLP